MKSVTVKIVTAHLTLPIALYIQFQATLDKNGFKLIGTYMYFLKIDLNFKFAILIKYRQFFSTNILY